MYLFVIEKQCTLYFRDPSLWQYLLKTMNYQKLCGELQACVSAIRQSVIMFHSNWFLRFLLEDILLLLYHQISRLHARVLYWKPTNKRTIMQETDAFLTTCYAMLRGVELQLNLFLLWTLTCCPASTSDRYRCGYYRYI